MDIANLRHWGGVAAALLVLLLCSLVLADWSEGGRRRRSALVAALTGPQEPDIAPSGSAALERMRQSAVAGAVTKLMPIHVKLISSNLFDGQLTA
jgi:hypothetical protein